jgi:hypothetical protein
MNNCVKITKGLTEMGIIGVNLPCEQIVGVIECTDSYS